MTTRDRGAAVQAALAARLRAAAVVLDCPVAAPDPLADPAHDAAVVISGLVDRLRTAPGVQTAWAVLTAIGGCFPSEDLVVDAVRSAELDKGFDLADRLLQSGLEQGRRSGTLRHRIEFVTDRVLLDVGFSATSEHNTGIQRVARNTAPVWAKRPATLLVAWTGQWVGGYRRLNNVEESRVLHFERARPEPVAESDGVPATVVPWNCVVVLTEVPALDRLDGLTALARFSGNRVCAIGYDTIPLVSRDLVPRSEMIRFGRFLTLVKYLHVVAAISGSAAAEFQGFVRMLSAQGLAGPRVVACSLPSDSDSLSGTYADRPLDVVPLVLCVGSKEPRKNHVAVLVAAERLWRADRSFRLRFVGSYGWDTRHFRKWLRRLERAGRLVQAPAKTSDVELAELYKEARFTVFPSIHEGFGLPVAESLAVGTPVLTTGYGSTGEIAADGGCLTVDSRSDDAIWEGMRRLLDDDDLIKSLRSEAFARRPRGWTDYANDLWAQMVTG